LIHEGEIELITTDEQSFLLVETDQLQKTIQIITSLNFDFEKMQRGLKIFCKREDNVFINRELVKQDINVYNLKSVSKTLEERFLGITNHELKVTT